MQILEDKRNEVTHQGEDILKFIQFDFHVSIQINYFVYLDELGCLSFLVNRSLASELLQPLLDFRSLRFELIGHHHH